jgi:PGF-CTERM protein
MEKKTIMGLIALLAIEAIVISSGCIERGEATPSTVTILTPKQIEASDSNVTIILDKVERADVLPSDIISELTLSDPWRYDFTPSVRHNFVCVYLTFTRIENVHVVGTRYEEEYSVLLDDEGHKYKPLRTSVTSVKLLDPTDLSSPWEIINKSKAFFVFEIPKPKKPVKFSFVYAFKETWEEKSAKRGQIDINLTPTPTPTLTPTPTPTPTLTPTPSPSPSPSPTPIHTPVPTPPGFEVIFAIVGLLAVAYLLKRRK